MLNQEKFLVKLFCQIGEVLIGLVLKSGEDQPLLQKELTVPCMVLRIVFHKEFSQLAGGFGHSADSNGIPLNQPTISHPILIVAVWEDSSVDPISLAKCTGDLTT